MCVCVCVCVCVREREREREMGGGFLAISSNQCSNYTKHVVISVCFANFPSLIKIILGNPRTEVVDDSNKLNNLYKGNNRREKRVAMNSATW